MKKVLVAILALFMLFGSTVGFAEGIDLSGMSEEELKNLIDAARLEMTKYHPVIEEGMILYEDENIKMTYTGTMEIDMFDQLVLKVIVENNSEHNLIISCGNVSCNGWSIWDASIDVPAKKKAKTELTFMDAVESAELTAVEDVQDIECDIYYFDEDTWENIIEPVHVIWNFAG